MSRSFPVPVVGVIALLKGQRRLDVRKYFFPRGINEWNQLSADCVHSGSIKEKTIIS